MRVGSNSLNEVLLEANEVDPRIVRLSRDADGREVWLDTETGQQLTGVVERREALEPHGLIAQATQVLDEFKWRWYLTGAHSVSCRVGARHATYWLSFWAYDDRPMLLCMVDIPVNVPTSQRVRALDYLNRVNWAVRRSTFELNPDHGEVRVRLATDASGGAIVPEMIRQMVHTILGTSERYFPGLMSVVFGGVEPAEAIESVESPS